MDEDAEDMNNPLDYRMKLVLGDWSEDGHKMSDEILLHTNHPVEAIQIAYKAACKLTGISFNHNEDFTETKREWDERRRYYIATEYEKGLEDLTPEVVAVLHNHKIPRPGTGDPQDEYVKLWFNFVKLILPDLTYTLDEPDNIPVINGYWNKNLNVQFGYGLYTG